MAYEIPQTKEEFERLVLAVKETERLSFVKVVYRVMDELTEQARLNQNPPFVCSAGCSFCCHQLVCCTKMEWRVIHEYLLGRGLLRGEIAHGFRDHKARWLSLYTRRPELFGPDLSTILSEHLGKPCPFLNGQRSCQIYPVRPVDCRTMYSKARCQDWKWPEVVRFPFPWDMWANNMILEEDKRSSGRNIMGVTPLPHWLCTIQF